MIDPLIIRVVSLAFGLLLLGAAAHKLAAMPAFRAVLADYQLMPVSLVPFMAIVVPIAEIVLGVGWISGIATETVASATALLLVTYGVAIAVNLLRGRVHITCGCGFGRTDDGDEPLSWWLVARNAILAGAALTASLSPVPRELGILDWVTVVLALTASSLLYLGGSQLLQNGAAIRSWSSRRRPRD